MLLATTQVEDFERFLEIFSTTGAEKRKQHGSKSALVFRDPSEDDRVWVVFDWDERVLGAVLLALLRAGRGEDLHEAVEVLDLRRREEHRDVLSSCVYAAAVRGAVVVDQAVRTRVSTTRSCGSIGPRLSTISNRPSRAWPMYMLMRTWCWPGTMTAGPPGPSAICA